MRFLNEKEFKNLVQEENTKYHIFLDETEKDFYQKLYDFLDINNLWVEAEEFFGFEAGILTSAYVDFDKTVELFKKKVTPFGSSTFQIYGNKNPVINAVVNQSRKSKEIELTDTNGTTYYFPFEFEYKHCVHNIQIVGQEDLD